MYCKRKKIRLIISSIREGKQLNASCVASGITPVTFYAWREANPRLKRLVKKAQELSDNKRNDIVVDSLFKTAAGGNVAAIAIWLKYKMGWRDDPLVDQSSHLHITNVVAFRNPEALKEENADASRIPEQA